MIGSAGSTGTDGDDIIKSTGKTLTALDDLDGGLGVNKLIIQDPDAVLGGAIPSGLKLKNIQEVTIGSSGSIGQLAATATTAQKEIDTLTFVAANATSTSTLAVTYGSTTLTTAALDATPTVAKINALVISALNAIAGSTIAADIGGKVVVTAPVAGTALPAITVVASTPADVSFTKADTAANQVAAAGATAAVFDLSSFADVKTLTVTDAVNTNLKVGSAVDATISGATAAVQTEGGKSVSVTQSMDTAADSITINKAGAVTVTATDSKAVAGGITIGTTAADGATGAVAVTSTGAKIVGGTGAVALDTITINGGTTVSVTQAATADMGDVATKGTLTDVVTQGAVTVTGGNATTSVTVKQGDQVAAKAAVAAVAGVSATQTVTFKAMAKGDTVTVDNLKFTAAKVLTAAEVAAAFAGLTGVENQGQGFSSNGIYTLVTLGNWNSGAVSGDTVTYSQKVANVGGWAAPTATLAGAGTIPTPTVVAGATGVTAVVGVAGVLGVANGAVVINDNTTTASIKTVVVDGYSAGATLGGTNNLNALTNLTLANSGAGTAAVTTNAATLGLTVNDVTAGVTLTDTSLKTLNVTTATKDSKFALAAVTTVETLNVDGTNAVDLTGTAFSGLTKVTVGGSAGLTVAGVAITDMTTTTTGTVNATIDSTKATYTGGDGVDNVTFSNTTFTATDKAIKLGGGNDTLTLAVGTATTPVATMDGGTGVNTLAMASANAATVSGGAAFAAKFTNFQKLSLGATATAGEVVNLANMNNIDYVISANTVAPVAVVTALTGSVTGGGAAAKEFSTFTIGVGSLATIGQSLTISGKTVTVTVDKAYTVAEIASAFAGTAVAGLAVSGTVTTPAGATPWTGTPVFTATPTTVVVTNTVFGDVTDFTASTGTTANATAATLELTKMANNGTLELTNYGAGAKVTMLDATSLTADTFNIVTKVSAADLQFGTVDVAGVETVNITATDTAPLNSATNAATINTAVLNLKDAAVKSVVVTGNSHLTLTSDTLNVVLTSVDASTNFTGNLSYEAKVNNQVVKGGSGADILTANADDVTLTGGAGNDTLIVEAGADRAILTGGAGVDTFFIKGAATLSSVYANITAVETGDIIKFAGATAFEATKVTLSAGATETTQALMDLAVNNLAANGMGWFQTGGNTFIVMDAGADSTAGFIASQDMVVMITGLVDLSKASFSGQVGTLEIA